MIDSQEYLIPITAKKTLLVSDSDWGLRELEGLLTTLGAHSEATFKVPKLKQRIDPRTYLGKGKLEELVEIVEQNQLDAVVFDFDLSPSQTRNLEKKIKRLVVDRSSIILEIFNRHARTKEAKLQVEIARLQYLMPRLTGMWSHFERQRGSGGGALKGKGMGEKQIEVDRRLIKNRITFLNRKLKEVEGSRTLQRKNREELLKVAIVGYTNAGKSTLLNALTDSEALVEDALFATLDAQIKLLNPKARPSVLAIDTVGFIDRLPHGLVASFRSTLAEVLEADLLVHVLDASDAEMQRHFEVTMAVLAELGAEKIPMIVVFNKMDKVEQPSMVKVWGASLMRTQEPVGIAFLSSQNKSQVKELRNQILAFFEKQMEILEILVPFEDGKTVAKIFELGRIEKKHNTEKGTFIRLRTTSAFAKKMNLEKYKI